MTAPETRSVVVEDVIPAPLERVWPVLSDFGALARYAAVSSCTTQGEGVGMLRTVTGFGKTACERLDEIDHERHRYVYSLVGKSPVPIASSVTTVTADAVDGGTRVVWHSEVEPKVPFLVIRPILEMIFRNANSGLKTLMAKD
jgi:uncharacterized protein YndB with AHSA1/START domain